MDTPRSVYHLALDESMIAGARVALLPGDPKRVEKIAAAAPLRADRELADKREFRTWLARAGEVPLLVTSTGIGGPSAAIAIDELAQIGLRTLLRVGTTGGIQAHVNVGDVVIASGAVRLDGASGHYAPPEFPAVAHHEVVAALIEAARELGVGYHVGVTCSTDTFYPGQERVDSFTGYVPRRFQGATEEWRRLGVLNYEMEAATLLTLGAVMGLRAGCVAGVVVNRTKSEKVSKEDLELGERNAVNVGALAAFRLARG